MQTRFELRSLCLLYIRSEVTTTVVYQNINSLFIYYEMLKLLCVCLWERERERVKKLPWLTPHCNTYIQSLAFSCFFHWRFNTRQVFQCVGCRLSGLAPKTADWSPRLTLGLKILYIFWTPTHSSFLHPTYTIHPAFSLSFVYLKTQVHILFWNPQLTWPVKG